MDQAITRARSTSTEQNHENFEFFEKDTIGYFLITINVMCMVLMFWSLTLALSPIIKAYCCCCCRKKKNAADTKVNPEESEGNDDGGGD